MAAIFNFKTSSLSSSAKEFVPSVEKEDKAIYLSEDFGFVPPTKTRQHELIIPPYTPKPMTWAARTQNRDGKTPEEIYYDSKKKEIQCAEFENFISEQEGHEDMLEEAAEWLEQEVHFMNDQEEIVRESLVIPEKAVVEIRLNKVFATYSFGSIAGQSIVFIPWGSKTNYNGPASIPQAPAAQKPLRPYEMIYAEIEWNPQGQNFWKVTKIFPKLNTEEMLTSISKIQYSDGSGAQYNYEIPCDPQNIGAIIGRDGKNIKSLIENISGVSNEELYPQVSIKPICPEVDPEDPLSFSFTPKKTHVCVYCPVNSGWTDQQVEELVSYMHS